MHEDVRITTLMKQKSKRCASLPEGVEQKGSRECEIYLKQNR